MPRKGFTSPDETGGVVWGGRGEGREKGREEGGRGGGRKAGPTLRYKDHCIGRQDSHLLMVSSKDTPPIPAVAYRPARAPRPAPRALPHPTHRSCPLQPRPAARCTMGGRPESLAYRGTCRYPPATCRHAKNVRKDARRAAGRTADDSPAAVRWVLAGPRGARVDKVT